MFWHPELHSDYLTPRHVSSLQLSARIVVAIIVDTSLISIHMTAFQIQ